MYFKRLVKEYKALEKKWYNGHRFYWQEMAEPKFTDERQRRLLGMQLMYMKNYLDVLFLRIKDEEERRG